MLPSVLLAGLAVHAPETCRFRCGATAPVMRRAASSTRCAVALALVRIGSQEELDAIEASDGIQVLMIARRGCKYTERMERAFARRCENNFLNGLLWVVEDDATAASLGATRTPFFVAFDGGERTFDFVAQSEGALLYGLQDVSSLIAAYDEPGM